MPDSYPYIISNNKISTILSKVQQAAKPPKFTHEFLKKMGFVSSNDRAIVSILKRLGFLTDDGTPTGHYDRLKDSTDHAYVLGERIKDLYKELFAINTEIYKAPDDEIKGAIARITGKDETSVKRYAATFKTLCGLAKFDLSPSMKEDENKVTPQQNEPPVIPISDDKRQKADFHYNIQIHLPATTDISVYNAIFKSLRDNLLI